MSQRIDLVASIANTIQDCGAILVPAVTGQHAIERLIQFAPGINLTADQATDLRNDIAHHIDRFIYPVT